LTRRLLIGPATPIERAFFERSFRRRLVQPLVGRQRRAVRGRYGERRYERAEGCVR
jgi:hypothetical protein